MPKSLLLKWLFGVVCIVIIILSITYLYPWYNEISAREIIPSEPIFSSDNKIVTKRIKIPKINVDASIESVGLISGRMDVPEYPMDTAWLSLSSFPGEIGNAVIDGHSGYKDNIPAVFDDLHLLRIGDKLYIEDEKGKTIVFVVRETKIYDPDADALKVFSSSDGLSHLNLITCVGTWDTTTKSRSNRLVVFSDRE